MKRITLFVICVSLLLAFVGCGQKGASNVVNEEKNDNGEKQTVSAGGEPTQAPVPTEENTLMKPNPAISMDELKEKYPEYFDLSTFKGLEVYVWQMAPNSYSCGVLPGTNREKTWEELWNLKGTTIEEMRAILSTYEIPKGDIIIIPWQNPISSYLGEYWITMKDEDPDAVASRRQAYVDKLNEMLLDEAPMVTKVAYANWTEDSRIFECLNAETMYISSVRHLPVYKLDTEEDLQRFKETFKNILTLDYGYNEVPSFNEVTAGYDEEFFAKHTVILAYVTSGSGSFRYGIRDVAIGDSTLCLNVVQTNHPEVGTSDMAGWFVMAEVLDADIANITKFDAQMVKPEDPIGDLFDVIMSSPSFSSNPGDYLRAHEYEHQQLLADRDATLRYIFTEFLNAQQTGNSQTGLKGHIMVRILDELAPESQLKLEAETAQEYFDKWAAYAQREREQHGDAWMEENQPAMYLLLQMIDESITPVQLPGSIPYGSFSFEEVKKSLDLDAPNVRTDGFVNVDEIEMGWPTDRAKQELMGDYDLAQLFYDEAEDVWMVHFWNSKRAGGNETVYLNGKGVTLLIEYGE